MKSDFPTEHVVGAKPVTMEAFVALMAFALPIAVLGFGIYWLLGRKKRREEKEFEEYMKQRNESPALKKH